MRPSTVLIALLVCVPHTASGVDDLRHAREFESMRESMHRLDVLLAERRMTQPEIERSRSRQARYIAAQASALADAAMALVENREGLSGPAGEPDPFGTYAAQLANDAAALQAAIDAGEVHQIGDHLDRLQQTCAGCHARFRDKPE